MSGNTRFDEFIQSERERFEIDDNNVFAFSFGHVSRDRDFLSRILKKHRKTSRRFVSAVDELRASLRPGRHPVDRQQMRQWARRRDLIAELHMEIEGFYLFAKILLDKVAHAIEFHFGQVYKASLDSHDDLVKNLEKYWAGRKLESGTDFQRFASMASRKGGHLRLPRLPDRARKKPENELGDPLGRAEEYSYGSDATQSKR